MTTDVYPRFLRLAAGKLIAVVVTLAEYLNILIDTRHMNVNIYTRCSHQLVSRQHVTLTRPLAQSIKKFRYVKCLLVRESPQCPSSAPLSTEPQVAPDSPRRLRYLVYRGRPAGEEAAEGGPGHVDIAARYIALHCVTLRYIIVTCKVGAYPI